MNFDDDTSLLRGPSRFYGIAVIFLLVVVGIVLIDRYYPFRGIVGEGETVVPKLERSGVWSGKEAVEIMETLMDPRGEQLRKYAEGTQTKSQ